MRKDSTCPMKTATFKISLIFPLNDGMHPWAIRITNIQAITIFQMEICIMDTTPICSHEQDAIIDIKAAILQEVSRLYKKREKSAATELLKCFDLFPCLTEGSMVEKAHDPCTYPRCAVAHKIERIQKAIAQGKYQEIPLIVEKAVQKANRPPPA